MNPSLLGDSARGIANLAEASGLEQRVALELQSVDRIGGDLRILART